MKFRVTLVRVNLVLALAPLACVGEIAVGLPTPRESVTTAPVPPGSVGVDACNEATLARPRVWRLTNLQIQNTLRDGLGSKLPSMGRLPASNRLEGFANRADNLPIDGLLADLLFRISTELADDVVARNAELINCPQGLAGLSAGTCLKDFLDSFALKIWRRPLTDGELSAFSSLYSKTAAQGGSTEAGLRTLVQAFFMSPSFLFRSELGDTQQAGAVTRLTDYELASALSYTLWDTSPDALLMDLARQGKLHDKNILAQQAMRLLGSRERASASLHNFMEQRLYIENLPEKDKDPELFSLYSKEVAADLAEESRLYLDSVIFDPGADRSFKTLFTASHGFVNARTAPIYGIQNRSGDALTRTDLDRAQRRGILTLAGFMASHADPDGTALVDRGRYLREEILCATVPPPPDGNVAALDPKFATADMTGREKFVAHSADPQCNFCHALFDGLGFAMESYDAIGRFRSTDKGKPLDPSGTVPLPSDGTVLAFDNFVDLVDKLADTKDLYSCFSSQYLTYATGRRLGEVKECERQHVADEFERSGFKLDALILSVINTPNFSARRN
jgi:hypothetical protein